MKSQLRVRTQVNAGKIDLYAYCQQIGGQWENGHCIDNGQDPFSSCKVMKGQAKCDCELGIRASRGVLQSDNNAEWRKCMGR